MQHRRLQPDKVSTSDLYGKSHGKGYNRPIATCKDKVKGRLMVLFCRKLNFPNLPSQNFSLTYYLRLNWAHQFQSTPFIKSCPLKFIMVIHLSRSSSNSNV